MAVFSGNGSAASPSFTFSSDTNTGIYRVGADQLGFATAGANVGVFTSGGDFGVGIDSPAARIHAFKTSDTQTTLFTAASNNVANTTQTRFDVKVTSSGSVFLTTQGLGTAAGADQLLFGIGSTEVARFTSSGQFGIGITPNVKLQVYDGGTATDSPTIRASAGAQSMALAPTGIRMDGNVDMKVLQGGSEVARWTNTNGYYRLSANSQGIQFNGDTAAANALNDYEEGTSTMVFSTSSGTFNVTGFYRKIGKLVFVTAEASGLAGKNLVGQSGSTCIAINSGWPFGPPGGNYAGGGAYTYWPDYNNGHVNLTSGTTVFSNTNNGMRLFINFPIASISGSGRDVMMFNFTYIVD